MAGAFVIAVSEQRQSALAGCAGQDYTSPPQSLEQARARALAGLLLGAPVTGAGPWRHAIAGGQRTIELVAELDAGQATGRAQSSGPWIGRGPQPPERGQQ